MAKSSKCKRVKSHCRKLSGRSKKASTGRACQAKGGSAGTRVSSFYSPKALCAASASKIAHAARLRAARKKGPRKSGRKTTPSVLLNSGMWDLSTPKKKKKK